MAENIPVIIGRYVTIGHLAMLHACTVENECLIGMHSTILDGAVVGHNSIIGAHTLVTQGMLIPPGSMVLGVPGKIVRSLSEEEQGKLPQWAENYLEISAAYCSGSA
jgi:carbonic anhydrase/acetyltransferase-like protein (isoleucine patch superfamily)